MFGFCFLCRDVVVWFGCYVRHNGKISESGVVHNVILVCFVVFLWLFVLFFGQFQKKEKKKSL